MYEYSDSVVIHRFPHEVFAFLTDPTKFSLWRLDCYNLVMLTEGPLAVGSRWTEALTAFGRQGISNVEVTGFVQDQKFTTATVSGGAPFEAAYDFEAIPEGTRLTILTRANFGGLLKMVEPMIKSKIASDIRGNLDRIKLLLEGDEQERGVA